jgi:peptide/nickel transport system substrate-binding protein
MLEKVESGERVTLTANVNSWEGKPALAGVVFKIVPDAMVRALEFKQGAIDLMQNDLEPDMFAVVEKSHRRRGQRPPGTTFQYIGINLTHPILQHLKVRQALAHAIDRERIIRHLLKDAAVAANGLISPLNEAYDENIPAWSYDPARAKHLLDEAGFKDPDGDGPLTRFGSRTKQPISTCAGASPKRSRSNCSKSVSSWRFVVTSGALFSAM